MDYGIWVDSPEGTPTEVTNMIANGTFDTSDGWSFLYNASSYLSIADGYLKGVGGTETYVAVSTASTISLTANHVYYCCVKYKKSGGGNTRWGMHNMNSNISYRLDYVETNADDFTKLSMLYTPTANITTNFLLYACGNKVSTDLVVYWDDLFVIDLTAIYGAGNEPSQGACDGIFAMIDGKVFRDVPNVAREVEQIYVDGEGKALIKTNLYNVGDECTDITGGFTLMNFYGGSTTYCNGVKNTDSLKFTSGSSSSSWHKRGFGSVNKIDFSNYHTMYVEYDCTSTITSAEGGNMVGAIIAITSTLTDGVNSNGLSGDIKNLALNKGTVGDTGVNCTGNILSVDISDINESAYLAIYMAMGKASGSYTANIKRVWLEGESETVQSHVTREVTEGLVEVDLVARKFWFKNPFRVEQILPTSGNGLTINSLSVTEENNVIVVEVKITATGSSPWDGGKDLWLQVFDCDNKSLAGKSISFQWMTSGIDNNYGDFNISFRQDASTSSKYWTHVYSNNYQTISETLSANTNYIQFYLWFCAGYGTRTLKFYIKDLTIGGERVHLN